MNKSLVVIPIQTYTSDRTAAMWQRSVINHFVHNTELAIQLKKVCFTVGLSIIRIDIYWWKVEVGRIIYICYCARINTHPQKRKAYTALGEWSSRI